MMTDSVTTHLETGTELLAEVVAAAQAYEAAYLEHQAAVAGLESAMESARGRLRRAQEFLGQFIMRSTKEGSPLGHELWLWMNRKTDEKKKADV